MSAQSALFVALEMNKFFLRNCQRTFGFDRRWPIVIPRSMYVEASYIGAVHSPVAMPSNRDKTRIGRLRDAGMAGYNLGASCNVQK